MTTRVPNDEGGFSSATGGPTSGQGLDSKPGDGITDETGEYGPGVDQDTGAGVGDTGKPALEED